VFFSAGVAVMGSVRVTTLYPQGSRDLELPPPPSPEMESSSSKESLRVVFKDGDLFGA
jgi:hypothetical protein